MKVTLLSRVLAVQIYTNSLVVLDFIDNKLEG